jgi:hypothetical protein
MPEGKNTINLTNVTVERKFNGGFIGSQTYTKRDGSQGKTYYKVWFKGVLVDDALVNVQGSASAKLNQYTDRNGVEQTTAELQVNAYIVLPVTAETAPAAPATNAAYLEDAPF